MLIGNQEDHKTLQDTFWHMGGGMEAGFSVKQVGRATWNQNDFNFIKLFNVDFMLFMENIIAFRGT